MKAGVIKKPGELELVNIEEPVIAAPDEVKIKVKRVGICGSDVHIYHGKNPYATYPRIWGHEFTGEVVEKGADVTNVEVGDHVVAEQYYSCGKCYACTHGWANVCKDVHVFGVHQEGGCREYMIVKAAKLYKMDPSIPWDVAVLTEPISIGFQATSRGKVMEGDNVLVMGAGTIGLTLLMAAKAKGAKVMITDLFDDKLEYAKTWGADYTVNVKNQTIEDAMKEADFEPNVVLDAVGIKKNLEDAVEMVSPAGRVVELGFPPITADLSLPAINRKEVSVYGTRLQSGQYPASVKFVEEHAEQLADFATQKYAIEDVQEAFKFATEHPGEFRKIVISME